MSLRTFLEALTAGGRTALAYSAAGFAILLVYSLSVAEKVVYLPLAVSAVALVSILLGAVQGGMSARAAGWLHGAIVAAFYLAVLQLLRSFAFPNSGLTPASLVFAAGALLTGCAGGIAGINLRFIHRSRIKRRYMGL